jgi:hypothetical protein
MYTCRLATLHIVTPHLMERLSAYAVLEATVYEGLERHSGCLTLWLKDSLKVEQDRSRWWTKEWAQQVPSIVRRNC